MKKLLIATAALAMVAGTAQAQSSVTVYGIVDYGYTSLEQTKADGTKNDLKQLKGGGEASTSRIGFRGTEDLGGGTKATFVLESGIDANSVFTFGGRAYWVGLESAGMGEVRLGRQDAFIRSAWLGADQLAAANVIGNLANDNGTALASEVTKMAHTTRHNAANYFSPRMGGLQVTAGFMQSDTETTTTAKNGSGSQFGVNYVAGKFTAAVASASYTQDAVTATGAFGASAATSVGVPGVTATGKNKEVGGGLTYDFGAAKVGYVYNDRDVANADQRTSHAFSASIPVNAKLTARVGYGMGDYAATPTATKYDLTGYQAALNYALSKRTTVYAIYGNEERDTSATQKVKAEEISVGVRHSF
jgi:predicted porin